MELNNEPPRIRCRREDTDAQRTTDAGSHALFRRARGPRTMVAPTQDGAGAGPAGPYRPGLCGQNDERRRIRAGAGHASDCGPMAHPLPEEAARRVAGWAAAR